MKNLLSLLPFFFITFTLAQTKTAADFGFRQLQTTYKGDPVDILIKSKKGEELVKKPLFIFCQGSLPQPLIKYNDGKCYAVFPFPTDSLEKEFHLVIISKPFIPVTADAKILGREFMYKDPQTGKTPKDYSDRNLLDYYVDRNLRVIDFLESLPYADSKKLVVAGHSEGSTVAAKLAAKSRRITHLIYASGNPLGRIMSIIAKDRANETGTASSTEGEFEYWESVVKNKDDMDSSEGDTNKATYGFSNPSLQYLQMLTIPVLVCYGTKDFSVLANDYLRVEMIRQEKTNFTFKVYPGLDHNFFPLKANGEPDYFQYNWNAVAKDWQQWLLKQ